MCVTVQCCNPPPPPPPAKKKPIKNPFRVVVLGLAEYVGSLILGNFYKYGTFNKNKLYIKVHQSPSTSYIVSWLTVLFHQAAETRVSGSNRILISVHNITLRLTESVDINISMWSQMSNISPRWNNNSPYILYILYGSSLARPGNEHLDGNLCNPDLTTITEFLYPTCLVNYAS